jgi:hypothetical protein
LRFLFCIKSQAIFFDGIVMKLLNKLREPIKGYLEHQLQRLLELMIKTKKKTLILNQIELEIA